MMKTGKQLPDSEILEMLQDRRTEQAAIMFLYNNHFEALSWFVRNNNGDPEDAQDIFQEVIVAFISQVRQNKFRGESSIATFLFAMNRNLWLNELKKRNRTRSREKNYELLQGSQETGLASHVEESETRTELFAIMDRLGETCKKILLLFYYENLSTKEMVEQLPYETEQVVRNKKYKCLKKLEEMMNAEKTLYERFKNLLHG